MGDANPICTFGDYSKPSHEGYRNTIELPVGNNVAISLPQDVLSTSDHRLIELENQLQSLMEAHLAPMQRTQVNKITSSCEIYSGPYDTQYCMENLEQAFVEYASSCTDEAKDARLSKFKVDFKQQQSEMTNKIDIVLKAIIDRIARALPSDTFKNPKLNINSTSSVLSARSYPKVDPQCSSHPSTSINAVRTCSKEASHSHTSQLLGNSKLFDTLADLRSCVNIIMICLFKKLKIRLLEETDHIFGLADRLKSYPIGIVKDIEVHIGKLKLLNDFYVIDIKKDPETPLIVGRGFLATANVLIDCRKAKIAV
uniref:MAK10-like protein n=1 Tax=Tanacetum cinerariifolium TaxID=118510 RepID=A0A6L2MX08_TANCI|nr:MAK10-like protein [Tanacetum cinerariifolium]